MQLKEVHYGNLKKNDFLDIEIERQMSGIEKVAPESASAELWLSSEGSLKTSSQPQYRAKIKVKQGSFEIFIKKSSSSFFTSINEAFRAARKTFKRKREKINETDKIKIKNAKRNKYTAILSA